MNGWLILGAIVVLWVFAFSLMYFSLWLEERRERKREKRLAERLRVTVGENVISLDDYRLDKYRKRGGCSQDLEEKFKKIERR
jgi:hypothetical protein